MPRPVRARAAAATVPSWLSRAPSAASCAAAGWVTSLALAALLVSALSARAPLQLRAAEAAPLAPPLAPPPPPPPETRPSLAPLRPPPPPAPPCAAAAAAQCDWRVVAHSMAPFIFPQLHGCPAPARPAVATAGKQPPEFAAAHGEDAWLVRNIFSFIPRANLSAGGTFVDVGALDGSRGSVSLHFERLRGWRGLLIEGHPQESPRLRAAASLRSRSAVFTAGVCAAAAGGANGGGGAPASVLFTPLAGSKAVGTPAVPVHCQPLQRFLDAAGLHDVDLLALDLGSGGGGGGGGGGELAVLETLDLAVANIRVVLFALSGEVERDDRLRALLAAGGFAPSPSGPLPQPELHEVWEQRGYEARLFARRSGASAPGFSPGYRPVAFQPGTAVACARSFAA